jgi:hypothetical protein
LDRDDTERYIEANNIWNLAGSQTLVSAKRFFSLEYGSSVLSLNFASRTCNIVNFYMDEGIVVLIWSDASLS